MISQRHLARIAAMQAIYSSLTRPNTDAVSSLEYFVRQLPEKLEKFNFSKTLLEGVFQHKEEIEKKVLQGSSDTSLEKIDILTLSILMLGTYELIFDKEKQPVAVVINEAVELAKSFAKDTAPSLVNAILSKISKEFSEK
jgi:transcription antitermination protein NusB